MKTLFNLVRIAFFCPQKIIRRPSKPPEVVYGAALLVWGSPGIGKSTIVESFARAYGQACEVLAPGERGEGQFGVVPVPEGGKLTYPVPDWVDPLEETGGVLFVDEINTAPPAIQPALLGLCLARRIGTHRISGNVRPIAAANETEDAAGGYDLPPALANRFVHVSVDSMINAEQWADGLVDDCWYDEPENILNTAATEAKIMQEWANVYSVKRGVVAGFIRRRPDMLLAKPKANDPNAGKAWASPRTWEMATRLLATCEILGAGELERDILLAGSVGEGPSGELLSFLREIDLPKPSDLISGKVKFVHDPGRLDRSFATLNALASYVVGLEAGKKQKDAAGVAWDILGEIHATGAEDLLVGPGSALVRAKLTHAQGVKPAQKVLAKLQPVLQAAGVQ